MIVDTTSTALTLHPGQVARLRLRAGTRLRGIRGTTWLTAAGDPRDIVLDPHAEWVTEHDGLLLACALRADGAVELQLDEPVGRLS
jgi:hypothetical protein